MTQDPKHLAFLVPGLICRFSETMKLYEINVYKNLILGEFYTKIFFFPVESAGSNPMIKNILIKSEFWNL